ncbi:MAG: alcohol dehydrogenase catalytic domain-containing protein [Halanaerobiaceae bacterium]
MKAAVLKELNKIEIEEVRKPEIDKDYGLLLEVKACSVCGSDIRIFRHGNERVNFPWIVGHEVAGKVIEKGRKVDKFNIGDRVALGADVPCGECVFCEDGRGNECRTNYAIGYQFQGGFAELMPLNKQTVELGPVHKIPEGVSYEEAALAEPLACCINGLELTPVSLGDTVVIVGAGPIGCMLVQLARIQGAKKIILAQRSQKRLEMAKKFKADIYISTKKEDLKEVVMEETHGLGADIIMIACASRQAQMDGLKLLAPGGMINFFGGLPAGSEPLPLVSNDIHYKQSFITGSHGSVPRQHRMALEMINSGRLDIESLITHTFSLSEIEEAFSVAENKEGFKAIVKP